MQVRAFFAKVDWKEGVVVPHIHEHHELYYCHKGSCTQIVGNARFQMHEDEFCLLPQGIPHIAYSHDDVGCDALVTYVKDGFISSHQSTEREARAILDCLCQRAKAGKILIPLSTESQTVLRQSLNHMEKETKGMALGWMGIVKAEMVQLLIELYRHWGEKDIPDLQLPQPSKSERIRDILDYIDINYMKPLMVDDLLSLAHLSRSHFHAVFAEEVGCSFKKYLNNVRTRHAEYLLASTDIPIAQIALGCGFGSLSHFYSVFRQLKKCSPRHYRLEAG